MRVIATGAGGRRPVSCRRRDGALIDMRFIAVGRASEHIQHAIHHVHEEPGSEGTTDSDEAHVDQGAIAATAGHRTATTGTGGYHPHESPWTMLVPLGVLSLGAIFAGILFAYPFLYPEEGAAFWAGSIAFDAHLMHEMHEVPMWVKLSATVAMALGLLAALSFYIWSTDLPEKVSDHMRVLYTFFLRKWYFDEIFHFLFVRPAFWIGGFFWKKGDEGTIDRFGPDGVAAAIVGGTRVTARIQTGYLYTYALVMLLGVAAAVTWAMAQ